MKCPYCDYLESKVIDSRPTDEGGTIRRRRECMQCARRFTTYEKVETAPIIVVKKDKSRHNFYTHYAAKHWGDSRNYNLSLDSGMLGYDLCVKLIVEAARG